VNASAGRWAVFLSACSFKVSKMSIILDLQDSG
jgi:hypothetical protein